jgi:hypothetical protein
MHDPDGYDNMLLKDNTRVCINGNGDDTFCVKKSGLFEEATCDDECKSVLLLLPFVFVLVLLHFVKLSPPPFP